MSADEPTWTREELYDKVWSVPTVQLAAELGISDVALAKRCMKLNVPRPRLGYWAKIAAGKKPRKKPLPPTLQEIFARDASKPLTKTVDLPASSDDLHLLASGLIPAIAKASPFSDKRLHVSDPQFPEVAVTKKLAERAAISFHVILQNVEAVGIEFRKAQGTFGPGFFKKGQDRLYLKIEEIVTAPGVVVTEHTSSTWPNDLPTDVSTGLLSFTINSSRYRMRDGQRWTETAKMPIGQVLSQLASAIRMHFVETQHKRQVEAIESKKRAIEAKERWIEYQRKEAIRLAEERKQRHAECLRNIFQTRANNLIKAAEWWRLYQTVEQYIGECETRWRTLQHGTLTPDQENWLLWARTNAKPLSPFETGYPDPANDGAFNGTVIPEGGPYPKTRTLPQPPTLSSAPVTLSDKHS